MCSQHQPSDHPPTAQINPTEFAYQTSANRWRSFHYAIAGIGYMVRWQKNIRIISLITVLVTGLGIWLEIARMEWAILALTIAFVWVTEFLNAGIEAAIDVASGTTYHPMAQVGKDVAAAAVLLASLFSLIVGLLIFLEPFLDRVFAIFE